MVGCGRVELPFFAYQTKVITVILTPHNMVEYVGFEPRPEVPNLVCYQVTPHTRFNFGLRRGI